MGKNWFDEEAEKLRQRQDEVQRQREWSQHAKESILTDGPALWATIIEGISDYIERYNDLFPDETKHYHLEATSDRTAIAVKKHAFPMASLHATFRKEAQKIEFHFEKHTGDKKASTIAQQTIYLRVGDQDNIFFSGREDPVTHQEMNLDLDGVIETMFRPLINNPGNA